MKLRHLKKQELAAKPFLLWNAYIDLLCAEEVEDLTAEQQPAHLVFWYESEVQNGGHLQYFENRGTLRLPQTIEALGALGAVCQQSVLREAGELWLSWPREHMSTVEQFSATASHGEFSAFDQRFHACSPDLIKCLESYLDRNQSSFVVLD